MRQTQVQIQSQAQVQKPGLQLRLKPITLVREIDSLDARNISIATRGD
ncbi:MAG: hypothetical protein LM583_06710 [Desulfurococcaceae archaeon]|nr:hypothetical protein [Desulfurococcaceae archaeon]